LGVPSCLIHHCNIELGNHRYVHNTGVEESVDTSSLYFLENRHRMYTEQYRYGVILGWYIHPLCGYQHHMVTCHKFLVNYTPK
jgi:hypothetical protein